MSHLSTASHAASGSASTPNPPAATPTPTGSSANGEVILCRHCGRTANNGISCEGYCVADSGY